MEDTAFTDNFDSKCNVNCVQLDGLVLLKIIKHCKESVPDVATGNLLGLNVKGALEVTNCFALPSSEQDNTDYQLQMMKCMRQVNVDNNTVGWYRSAHLGNFIDSDMLEVQYSYQKDIPCSVVVVYDPFCTTSGRLVIHAYRLSDQFMKQCAQYKRFAAENFTETSALQAGILEEVRIKVHNSHLVHGFLYEVRESKKMSCNFDRLSLSVSGFLEKNLDELSDLIDEYAQDQVKFQQYQRAETRMKQQREAYLAKIRSENEARVAAGKEPLPEEDLSKNPLFKPLSKPSRLDSIMISRRIDYHASQINSSANLAFHKLYTVDALHKDNRQ